MDLSLLAGNYAIARLAPGDSVPAWIGGDFVSVTHTPDELSVVCEAGRVPGEVQAEKGWRILKVAGPLAFSMVGVLASLSKTFADAGVSIFAVSTFDTDYILFKEEKLDAVLEALLKAGHRLTLE